MNKKNTGKKIGDVGNPIVAEKPTEAYRIEGIKTILLTLRSPGSCDVVIAMCNELKRKMTEKVVKVGDAVYLNDNCSILMKKYIGVPITVMEVRRDGSIIVDLDGISGAISRDKLTLSVDDITGEVIMGSEFGDEK